ncbi:hypothetical protein BD413DRAFT_489539 [Trametes elegans]|nr:hypothetical protein BD413DRAFT_489539 [Trametes elegans]
MNQWSKSGGDTPLFKPASTKRTAAWSWLSGGYPSQVSDQLVRPSPALVHHPPGHGYPVYVVRTQREAYVDDPVAQLGNVIQEGLVLAEQQRHRRVVFGREVKHLLQRDAVDPGAHAHEAGELEPKVVFHLFEGLLPIGTSGRPGRTGLRAVDDIDVQLRRRRTTMVVSAKRGHRPHSRDNLGPERRPEERCL